MRIFYFITLVSLGLNNIYAQEYSNTYSCQDSLSIEKTDINKTENSFQYILKYELSGVDYEVYREKVVDYSIECEYGFSFRNNTIDYVCYNFYSLVSGISWNVVLNVNDSSVYITDKYDEKAIGDQLVKDSLDFKSGYAIIQSVDNNVVEYYKISMTKIWSPKINIHKGNRVK